MKKLLAGAGMATILLAGAGVASAQDGGIDESATGTEAPRERPPHGKGVLLDRLGLERDELRDELEAGRTPAEIAADQGLDIDALIAEAVADAEAWVAENPESRVAEGFDAAELTERLTEMANRRFDPSQRPRHGGDRRSMGTPGLFADALGLERDELRAELEAGRTLAEIATGQGLDIDAVIGDIVEEMAARVAENPESRVAEGFDAAELTERLTEMANRPFDPSERPGHRRGHGDRDDDDPAAPTTSATVSGV